MQEQNILILHNNQKKLNFKAPLTPPKGRIGVL